MVAFWVPALYFYNQNQTSWTETPAASRTFNQPCILFDFFDRHDVWHLCAFPGDGGCLVIGFVCPMLMLHPQPPVSAYGLFSGCLFLLSLDDGLCTTPRSRIHVF